MAVNLFGCVFSETNLVLRADDGLGHEGESNLFDVQGAAAPLQLLNYLLSTSQFAFDLSGQPGCKLLIQASTDLQHWATLHGCQLTDSPLGFVDPESHLYPQRFYRLMDATGVARMEQQRWASGQFHLNLVGELGLTVVVEASTNLADWTPIAANVLGSDPHPPHRSAERAVRSAVLPAVQTVNRNRHQLLPPSNPATPPP